MIQFPRAGVEAPRLLKTEPPQIGLWLLFFLTRAKESQQVHVHDNMTAHARQPLRLIEPITCVMSSYSRSESSCTPPSSPHCRQTNRQSTATFELESCLHWPHHGACRCTTTGISTDPKNGTGTVESPVFCTGCTVRARLRCTTGMSHTRKMN